MKIEILSKELSLPKHLKDYIKSKLKRVLSARAEHVQSVKVSLVDVNGPKGGNDKLCKIIVKVDGMKEFVINEKRAVAKAAFDNASNRIKYVIEKRFQKIQGFMRPRHVPISDMAV